MSIIAYRYYDFDRDIFISKITYRKSCKCKSDDDCDTYDGDDCYTYDGDDCDTYDDNVLISL